MTPCTIPFFVVIAHAKGGIFMEEKTITLSKFLARYLLLGGEDLKKITHEEVRMIFTEVQRVEDKTKKEIAELVKLGKVLLVDDGYEVFPYYIPSLGIDKTEVMDVNREEEPGLVIDDNVYDYMSLTNYELRQLLRNKFNSARNRKMAKRELMIRGEVLTKKYKRSDYKIIEGED